MFLRLCEGLLLEEEDLILPEEEDLPLLPPEEDDLHPEVVDHLLPDADHLILEEEEDLLLLEEIVFWKKKIWQLLFCSVRACTICIAPAGPGQHKPEMK